MDAPGLHVYNDYMYTMMYIEMYTNSLVVRGLHVDAVSFLVDQRDIRGLGADRNATNDVYM
jgi:hypothetical protein